MENQMTDSAGTPSVESLVKRGYLFLEDSDWNKADEYFDRALDASPEYASAYIGKLCAELGLCREETLGDYNELRRNKKFNKTLGEYGHFQKALRFADANYREKLNAYDQKIKDSFPKTIPQEFTDEFIKNEIARLEKDIGACNSLIAIESKEARDHQSKAKSLENDRMEIGRSTTLAGTFARDSKSEIERAIQKSTENIDKYITEAYNDAKFAQEQVEKDTAYKAECEAKKRELVSLVDLSCLDRMDSHYNRFAEAMQKESTEDEYKKIAEQFRLLKGYKDSGELADKCGKLAIKLQYERLVREKTVATTEDEYENLSKQFREMGGYENAAQLADECNKLKEREKKARYDDLVQAKNNASSEGKYKQLAKEFHDMGGYENATQLAAECDNQVRVLEERRKEQERQEKDAREAMEAEEQTEIERYRNRKEEKERRKEHAKKSFFIFLTIAPIIAAFILYGIAFNGKIIGPLIFLLPSFALLHFRRRIERNSSLSGFVAFIATAIIVVTGVVLAFLGGALGLIALVFAIVTAYILPLENYT
jgi:hypothetical protein